MRKIRFRGFVKHQRILILNMIFKKSPFFLYNNYNDHVLHHFEERGEQVHTPGQFRILLLYFLHALLRVAALER